MCNEAARRIPLDQLRSDWGQTRFPLRFPEGLPNMAPLESIRITDPSVIVRAAGDAPGEAELVTRRWSWPGPTGKPVYNFRSDGRVLDHGPVPDSGRRVLRIYGSRRRGARFQEAAEEQVAVHDAGARLVLRRGALANGRESGRGLDDDHHGSGA